MPPETLIAESPVTTSPPPSSAPPAGTTTTPTATPPAAAPTDWRAGLPEDVRGHKSLEKFKSPGDLVKSYVEMEKYQGSSVRFPGENATPQEKQAFEQKINAYRGVPEAPDKYEITAPEGLPALDGGAVGAWQQTFHRLGLTADQAKGLTSEFFGSAMGNPNMASEALQTKAVELLRNEWGGGFDHNLEVAKVGAQKLGADFVNLMEHTGLGSHPTIVKMCLRVGKDYAEHGLLPKDAITGGPMGPDAARQRIAEIRADKTHAWHRGDPAALQEMTRLYEQLTAG